MILVSSLIFQDWLINIFTHFNLIFLFQWQLMMARREIGWERSLNFFQLRLMNIYNHFNFNFFGFQWWLMNIYFRFNFIWRLRMARRKIGWERSFRFRLMKIVTYFNFFFFNGCWLIFIIVSIPSGSWWWQEGKLVEKGSRARQTWASGQMTIGATIWKSIHLLFYWIVQQFISV